MSQENGLPILGLTKEVWILDAETASDIDLKKTGQYIYWGDQSTSTLMLSARRLYAPDTEPTHLWDFEARKDSLPDWFLQKLKAPPEEVLFAAANCVFDKFALERLGYETPPEKWIDILVIAYILGFSGRLDDVLTQVGLEKKDAEGTRLITLFSLKNRSKWHEAPDKWERFRQYCIKDSEVETRLLEWCLRWLNQIWFQPSVRKIIDQERVYRLINSRGLPVDTEAVEGAIKIRDTEISRLTEELKVITKLENPNSQKQLLGWLNDHGYPANSIAKDSIQTVLDAGSFVYSEEVIEVCRLRAEIGKSSVKKFDALKAATSADGRFRGGWQFYGASRTGRVAGRTLNPANLARPSIEKPEQIAEWLSLGDRDLLTTLFPEKPVLDTLSSCIRATLKAPEGKRWCVADLTSIESVGAAWLAGCQTVLDIFHKGRDTYKTFATKVYNTPYEEVTKEQRTFCKPCILGATYQLGGFGLQRYAESMGVDLDVEECKRQIKIFRSEFHEIPHYWHQLRTATIRAVKNPGQTYHVKPVTGVLEEHWREGRDQPYRVYSYGNWPVVSYWYDGTFLFCALPSGRFLCYYQPEVSIETITPSDGDPFTTESFSYMGIDQKATSKAWKRIYTHGGKNLENLVQSSMRDAMWMGLEQAEADPDLEVVGDIYDELLTLADTKDRDALNRLIKYMTTHSNWLTEDFFLGADGYISGRYKKG